MPPVISLLQRRRVEKDIHPPEGQPDAPGSFGAPLAGAGPVAVLTAPADALAGLAVETIAAWRAGGVDPADIAVLARVNSALLPVQVACMEAGVPCSTPLSAGVLQRTGIRTAFAYLRIGADPGTFRVRTFSRRSVAPPGALRPKWSTCSPAGRPRPSATSAAWPVGSRAATSPSSGSTPATSTPW